MGLLCSAGFHRWEYTYDDVDYDYIYKVYVLDKQPQFNISPITQSYVDVINGMEYNPILYHDKSLTWPRTHTKSEMVIISATGFLKYHMDLNMKVFTHNRMCKSCGLKQVEKCVAESTLANYNTKWVETELSKVDIRNKKIEDLLK